MANCKSFQKLGPKEKIEFIGELVHICQSDEACFDLATELIKLGREKGLMDSVVIGPDVYEGKAEYGLTA